MSFGRYLLRQGVLTKSQLSEFTHIMVVFGGRLGTVLVEAGVLSMEQLEDRLSNYLSLPRVPLDRVEGPEKDALAAISPDLAQRHAALPLFIEKRVLHVAMLDPSNRHDVEQLAFAAGFPISGYVIAERRLVSLLERYYGIRQDPRFTDGRVLAIAGHVDGAPPQSVPLAAGIIPTRSSAWAEHGEPAQIREALGIRDGATDRDSGAFGWNDSERSSAAPLRQVSPSAPEVARSKESAESVTDFDPAEAAHLEGELALLADRDALVGLVLDLARRFARRAALFLVRGDTIEGVAAAGRVSATGLRGLDFPLCSEGLLARTASAGSRRLAVPSDSGDDRRLLAALGSAVPPAAVVIPIRVAGRVVNLLYADNETGTLGHTSLAALDAVSEAAADAYERMILDMKRIHC